jgi:hypothetical protein
MNIDQLFVQTLDDLDVRLKSHDEYEILMIAMLIRKLILDENSLVDQVNRNRQQKIRFIVNDRPVPTTEPKPIFWSIEDGFDPNTSLARLTKPLEVTKDQLFSRSVLMSGNRIFTVKDIVKQFANVQGAIHVGMPKDEKEKHLKQLTETLGIGGLPAGLRLLYPIGRVIRKGLEPLKKQILMT